MSSNVAISVDSMSKMYRLYQEKNQYLKSTALRGRRAKYEEFWAVKNLSFDVPTGSTFGIIGTNGSGKSTVLKCLAGILSPDKGSIDIRGSLSALLELGAGFHPELSGLENIYLNGAILGMTRQEITSKLDDIISFAGLEKFINSPVKNYSSGMVVRLGFSIAASVQPDILLIDEVLAVGDEAFQRRCGEKIEEFRQDGRTIILVSHGLTQVQQLCDTTLWLDKGTKRMLGPTNEVVLDYLGESHDAQPKDEEIRGNRWGSGVVQISSVDLFDKSGSRTDLLATGQPAKIQISYRAHQRIQNAVVGVRITHIHGFNVWGSNTKRAGLGPLELSDTGTIDLNFESLSLLDGTYDLTVAISDMSEVNEFDHWDRRIRFDVKQGRIPDEGVTFLHGTWRA